MKYVTIIVRILLGLVILTPILGATGIFPAPTADLYTPAGWAFMEALMNSGYMFPLIAVTCAVALVLLIMNRTALAAVILAPFAINVACFHTFVEDAPISVSASLAYVLVGGTIYLLWINRKKYKALW